MTAAFLPSGSAMTSHHALGGFTQLPHFRQKLRLRRCDPEEEEDGEGEEEEKKMERVRRGRYDPGVSVCLNPPTSAFNLQQIRAAAGMTWTSGMLMLQ